jgi:hypothetical protein
MTARWMANEAIGAEERSDEVWLPDIAPEIIRQPERLECANDNRTPEGVQCTREGSERHAGDDVRKP